MTNHISVAITEQNAVTEEIISNLMQINNAGMDNASAAEEISQEYQSLAQISAIVC